jgi:cell division protease FtsH
VGILGIPRELFAIRPWPAVGRGPRPELAGVARLAGRVLSAAVAAARGEGAPAHRALASHLGPQAAGWPVATASWPAFDQVNVQAGLDAWLAGPGLRHELLGLTGVRRGSLDLADLTTSEPPRWPASVPGVGSATTVARPAGPGGITRACVICGVYLVTRPDGQRYAVLLRGPSVDDPHGCVRVQVTAADKASAGQVLDQIRALAVRHNVYRGQVISFGAGGRGLAGAGAAAFLDRPQPDRATVILPPDLLEGIERQVLGIARHSDELRVSGQHLKRGVLLHGPPGTGKTHTVRYLIGRLPDVTAIVISGAALRFAGEACAIAAALQPSIVVVEDIELGAGPDGPHTPLDPLLQLLGEMEGLSDDSDVTFLLTTNRAALLQEALAARPGQVNHTARLPLPDALARRRLLRLYQGRLRISRAAAFEVVARTEGVNASFIRELLRRAAVYAADGRAARAALLAPADGSAANGSAAGRANGSASGQPGGPAPDPAAPLRVSARHLNLALDELLDTRHDLTRVLLGSRPIRGADAVIRPVLPHLRPSRLPRAAAAVCQMTALEYFSNAPGPAAYEVLWTALHGQRWMDTTAAAMDRALAVHRTLAERSQHRHFPLPDLIIAATAEEHGATVLHYDAGYDRIAAVTGQPVEWVAPRGSL